MEKIAIVRRNGLGDLLCTFPLILYLKSQGHHITLFTEEKNAPLLPYLSPVDRSVILPVKGNKYWRHFAAARSHRGKFDIAISAKTSPMKLMNFFLTALKARERIAYIHGDWSERLLVNRPKIYRHEEAKRTHQALKTLHLVAPDFCVIPEELFPTARIQEESNSHPPTLLLCASTTRSSNRLNPMRYGFLANQIAREHSLSALIISQPEDRARAEAISGQISQPCQIYFPRTFDEFMILLNRCNFYFVGDGGVAHIGAALGKKGLVLFGESSPVEWAPMSKKMKTIYHPNHVDHLSDEEILKQVECGRENL